MERSPGIPGGIIRALLRQSLENSSEARWKGKTRVKVNLVKYECVVYDCGATANVLTDDGFVQVTHCLPCTRRGLVRRHIRSFNATITPLYLVPAGWEDNK